MCRKHFAEQRRLIRLSEGKFAGAHCLNFMGGCIRGARKLTPAEIAHIKELARPWGKVVVRHAFGEAGPGLDGDLDQMEEVALAAVAGLAAGTLEAATGQQAQTLGTEHACPTCSKVCPTHQEARTIHGLAGPLEHAEPACYCPTCRRDFFPPRPLLKLDRHAYTPRVLLKILEANGQVKSHDVAARVLRSIGGIALTGRHVNNLCAEIGAELAEQRDHATDDYLHQRRPPPQEAPAVAVIGMDGGRMLTRIPGQGPGVPERQWQEDQVAGLLSLTGATFADDPQPEPPHCFLDAPEVDKLVRELRSHHGPRLEDELPRWDELRLGQQAIPPTAACGAPEHAAAAAPERLWPPKRTKDARTGVATMQDCHGFGKRVAAEAYRRGFTTAARGVVLGDGSAWIWAQQEKWFPTLTAITDFVHALSYLYVTATACSSSVAARWQLHVGWMTDCWQGRGGAVLHDLQTRLEALGPYPGTSKPPPTDPRAVLQRTIT